MEIGTNSQSEWKRLAKKCQAFSISGQEPVIGQEKDRQPAAQI
jgi:uncharacterized Fe-S cluster-containing radical SAM superfamily protein